MLKKNIGYVGLLVMLILFTGCTHYDIEPIYNKEKKTVTINNVVFNNFYGGSHIVEEDRKSIVYKKYIGNSNHCNHISYTKYTAASRVLFNNSFYNKILSFYQGGQCDITKIGNLNFLECSIPDNSSLSYITNYRITSTSPKRGYLGTTSDMSLNKACYIDIKERTIASAEKDGVEIKHYLHKEKLPKDTQIFNGIMIQNSDGNENCSDLQNISLFYSKDKKYDLIRGFISFRKNGNSFLNYLRGHISKKDRDFVSSGLVFNVETLNKDEIRGSFKNKQCSGTFVTKYIKTIQ